MRSRQRRPNLKKFLKYALLTLLWASVAAYIVYASGLSRRERARRTVSRVEVQIEDSTSQGHLVSAPRVGEWLRNSGIRTIGTAVDAVDLAGIERLISKNGFVDRVAAYVTYGGVVRISISQREPVVRLLVHGFDHYVTSGGYLFAAPRAASLYMPVVTGSYQPPVPLGYEGPARTRTDTLLRRVDERIRQIGAEKLAIYRAERQNDDSLVAVRRMQPKWWWRVFGSEEYGQRCEQLKKKKTTLRARYRYRARMIEQQLADKAAAQDAERAKQKKLEKSYADFMKLLTFVQFIEEDDFWRSEVVQIVTRATPSGAMEVELIPRSGRHTILFGRLEQEDAKLDKLLRFYRKGLNNIGWDEYKTIDIRYNDQVVCRK